jgi:hypothetical protein
VCCGVVIVGEDNAMHWNRLTAALSLFVPTLVALSSCWWELQKVFEARAIATKSIDIVRITNHPCKFHIGRVCLVIVVKSFVCKCSSLSSLLEYVSETSFLALFLLILRHDKWRDTAGTTGAGADSDAITIGTRSLNERLNAILCRDNCL